MSFICYQVNSAWSFNHTNNQWVDLGIHTEACMAQSDTCGEAGGAISLWVNVIDCPSHGGGIVSSRQYRTTGSVIYCTSSNIVYETDVSPNISHNFLKNNIWRTSVLFSFRINNSTFKCFNTNCQSSSSLSFEEYFIIIVFSQVSCLSTLWIFWGISHQTNWMDPGCTELHWTEQWTRNQDLQGWTGSSNR